MENNIDFVIPWVDSTDENWQREKEKYKSDILTDSRDIRYRDLDNLQYWFRGVEKFAPWVNRIHFITWGHLPKWLDTNHPKLNIVNHHDYIPREYLPTFSSHVIELNLHRIKDLSEQFVFFNDDIFITRPVSSRDFFVDGIPKDMAVMDIAFKKDEVHGSAVHNSVYLVNKYFNKRESIHNHFTKWYNPIYGGKLIKTLLLSPWKYFTGFYTSHLANAYLKSTFVEVWEREYERLAFTSSNKFRDMRDCMQFVFKFWQIASGNFVPAKPLGRSYSIGESLDRITSAIQTQRHKLICMNDNDYIEDFEDSRQSIIKSFEKVFPDKSEFEI